MQKPTFIKSFTFIHGVAALLLAGTIFASPVRSAQSASSPTQQAPASSATQDSSAAPTPAKPAAKVTPEAKHAPAATSKAKPSATAPATKPAAAAGSQGSDAAKASSSASAPAASAKQTTTASGQGTAKTGSATTTKTSQAATSKTAKPGTSKTTPTKTATPLTLKTDKDKQSYAIGINVGKGLGQNLKRSGLEIDSAILTRAIKDVLAGDKQSMTDEQAQETLKTLQAELGKKQEEMRKEEAAKMKELGEANKKEGDEFLAANKIKEGVTTLPDGMQYKILAEGTGPKPSASDAVTVNYRGTLLNGTEFDSSYKRNQPATFNVTGIIKGWTEALQLMPVGSKWQLFIPSDLAYGPSGRPPVIGPNSTLVFEVELISIQPRPVAPAPAAAAVPNPAPAAAAPNAQAGNPAPAPNAPNPPKPAPPTPPTPKSDPAPAPNPAPKPPTP